MDIKSITFLVHLAFILICSIAVIIIGKSKNQKKIETSFYFANILFVIAMFWTSYWISVTNENEFSIWLLGLNLFNVAIYTKRYFDVFLKSSGSLRVHCCINYILFIMLLFAYIYLWINSVIPDSFSNITSSHWFDRTIEFIYFSVTTFTTVGFGDIAPQTTLARAVVTLEIITAFAMLVIAVNFVVVKKENKK